MTAAAIHYDSSSSPSRALRVSLWITQILLAGVFLMAGGMKLSAPVDQLAANMPWVSGTMGALVRVIGAAEVAGALGLILPSALRIQPRLTVLAAAGLVLLMLGGFATHLSRGEFSAAPVPLVLAALSAFVAWGRSRRAVIAPR